jgi:hypothetical protein
MDVFFVDHLENKKIIQQQIKIKSLPISQTLSLKPLDCTLLILKPCVGVICEISSEARTLSNVV